MDLKALILDVDGTLADTERDGHRVAFNRAFSEEGVPLEWSVEEYGKWLSISGGFERMCAALNEVGLFRGEEWARTLYDLKTRHYIELASEGAIHLRPGIRRILDEAGRKGVRLAVATTSASASIAGLFPALLGPDWQELFSAIITGDNVSEKKPHPEVYLKTLHLLGLNPEEALAVEDSAHGLEAARSAGIPCIVTVNDYTKGQSFPGAALVVDHLGEPGGPYSRVLSGKVSLRGGFVTLDILRKAARE